MSGETSQPIKTSVATAKACTGGVGVCIMFLKRKFFSKQSGVGGEPDNGKNLPGRQKSQKIMLVFEERKFSNIFFKFFQFFSASAKKQNKVFFDARDGFNYIRKAFMRVIFIHIDQISFFSSFREMSNLRDWLVSPLSWRLGCEGESDSQDFSRSGMVSMCENSKILGFVWYQRN